MHYVFCLGPYPMESRKHRYICVADSDAVPVMTSGPTKAAALEACLANVKDRDVVCEEGLRDEAAVLELPVGVLPSPVLSFKAAMAVSLDHGPFLGGAKPLPLDELLHAAARLEAAAPWKVLPGELTLVVHVEAPHPRMAEACVLGSVGRELGLAVSFDPGVVGRLARGEPDAVGGKLDLVALLFSTAPAHVVRAVEAATGSARVPVVVRTRGGMRVPATAEDLALLVATAHAILALAASDREGHGRSEQWVSTRVRVSRPGETGGHDESGRGGR